MQAVIITGGLATRLGDLTKNQPKSMLEINGKKFIEYQLNFLHKGGIRDIVICIGHLGEQIREYIGNGQKYEVNIKYSGEKKLLGTAGALKQAEDLLADVFFTIYGDSYLFLNFSVIMDYFKQKNKLALMTVYKNNDRYDKSNVAINKELVKRYDKREKTLDTIYIDYGANVFRKEALDMVPKGEFSPLEDLFQTLTGMNELLAYEVTERFYEIGSIQGLKEFKKYQRGVE